MFSCLYISDSESNFKLASLSSMLKYFPTDSFCNGMIERLNIEKIANAVKEQLNPLYKALGVEKIK